MERIATREGDAALNPPDSRACPARRALWHAAAVAHVVLFYRYRKIPFASSHVPGKLSLATRGVPYLVGLLALLAVLAGLEKSLLGHPGRFLAFLGAAVALGAFLELKSARFLKDNPLIYEEEPEPAMIGFPEDA